MTAYQIIASVVGVLGAVFGGWAWLRSAKRRWVSAGRQEERDRTVKAVVERERELSESERATYLEHIQRVSEIQERADELLEKTPTPSAVRDLIARSNKRAMEHLKKLLILTLCLAPVVTQARTETSTQAYQLKTELEQSLWKVAVQEEARADRAESDAMRLSEDLRRCREQPVVVPPSEPERGPGALEWVLGSASVVALIVSGVVLVSGR